MLNYHCTAAVTAAIAAVTAAVAGGVVAADKRLT